MSSGILNEAYERFQGTGPEWGESKLTNHGPMAVEVLVRRGHEDDVHRWVDAYARRLDDLPSARRPIDETNWREALGDGDRVGDWAEYFTRQVAERPWREVLAVWWPRLLPGILAGVTHAVIRVSHAVRTLLADEHNATAAAELAQGLAFWGARSLGMPVTAEPGGDLDPGEAMERVPRVPSQDGPVRVRLGQLPGLPGWTGSVAALRPALTADDVPARLEALVDAATLRYLTHGHASPVILVHTATAPNAVLHTLPALPRELWVPSLSAIWAACAGVQAAFEPVLGAPREALPVAPAGPDALNDVMEAAIAHGDEHVIKFTDTAAEVFTRTGHPDALAAAVRVRLLLTG
ncbi:questin oxidase family protein [Sphaerisporangium sp. TRM90804]|uniref:questin oxidase family protein n=1 Tax=Sphaerisporangium sp. TRM90804 TaxID=3031113 RepID=UPI002448613D|nr:questin oxidase family protein [Sphaerisporangium sp. TRM90804]MDH2426533.1 questin oxidase family protein [Sphaerisporangium sp. TRM90804]